MTVNVEELLRLVIGGVLGSLITNWINQRSFGVAISELKATVKGLDDRVSVMEEQYVLMPRWAFGNDGRASTPVPSSHQPEERHPL